MQPAVGTDRASRPPPENLARKIRVALNRGDVTMARETLLALHEEARQHHRTANVHKRRARNRMQEFDRFKVELAGLGVHVVVEPHTNGVTHPRKEGTSDQYPNQDQGR